ncbi:hypothetical protein C8Q78DRAFT_844530 [Trametes maxima]|nr:hypothetical protein C8Q78DRAFT_844530 [Trametes maxima]
MASRVEYLHLLLTNIQWHLDLGRDELLGLRDTDEPVEADSEVMQLIDVEALACTILQLCLSIRTIAITVLSVGSSVWEIDTVGGIRSLVKLEPYCGRHVMEEEERRCIDEWGGRARVRGRGG